MVAKRKGSRLNAIAKRNDIKGALQGYHATGRSCQAPKDDD
jgi:hypothetical protein